MDRERRAERRVERQRERARQRENVECGNEKGRVRFLELCNQNKPKRSDDFF